MKGVVKWLALAGLLTLAGALLLLWPVLRFFLPLPPPGSVEES